MISPMISLTLGGAAFTLSKEVYMGPMAVTLKGVGRLGPFLIPFTVPGVRCVPLLSSHGAVERTNIGPLIILGMPFLRQYKARFDRTTKSMAFARLGEGGATCDACAGAARRVDATSTAATALQPEAELTDEEIGVLRLEDVRLPWYALHPRLRNNGTYDW